MKNFFGLKFKPYFDAYIEMDDSKADIIDTLSEFVNDIQPGLLDSFTSSSSNSDKQLYLNVLQQLVFF